jgi:glycosyltransferase involved in cell wall biosynthesis
VLDGITGRLVPPEDPQALAAAVVDVLLDADLRARLRAGIRRLEDQDWGWTRTAAKLDAVYRGVVHRQP